MDRPWYAHIITIDETAEYSKVIARGEVIPL
jgi:hypothetical protein